MPEAEPLGVALVARRKLRPLTEAADPFSHGTWQGALTAAAAESLSLQMMFKPTLYSLRHGAASHMALIHNCGLSDLIRKGRWSSVANVRRYAKGGRLARVMASLPEAQKQRVHVCAGDLAASPCGAFRAAQPSAGARRS